MRHKIDDLERIIEVNNIDIIGITETWLDSSIGNGEIHIPGFSLHRLDRSGHRGGGVCIICRLYCRDSIPARPRCDLETDSTELAWLEIGSKKKFLFGCIYRPPHQPQSYWDELDSALSQADFRSQDRLICGDFNVDLTPGVRDTAHHDGLFDLCVAHELRWEASGTTRIGFRTPPSTLDLILLPTGFAQATCQVTDVPFSDHSLVSCVIDVQIASVPRVICECRNLNKIDGQEFRRDIAAAPFARVRDFTDVDDMWKFWLDLFMQILDSHAPLRSRRPRKKQSVPWMNETLLHLISRRRKLHRAYIRQNRCAEAYAHFRDARAKAHDYNRTLKSAYFLRQCELHSSDSRKMWKVINTVTGRQSNKLDPFCSAKEIGHVFNEIVTDNTRPPCLGTKLAPTSTADSTPLSSFDCVEEEKVRSLLARICPSKATGSDGVPGTLLKLCVDILAPSLTVIINQSLRTGTVPSLMKVANICPLHKGGDRVEPRNYRPVSLLPVVSKVLERVVADQLNKFLATRDVLPCEQFAYRRHHSTEDALTIAAERFLASRDFSQVSAAAFIDL